MITKPTPARRGRLFLLVAGLLAALFIGAPAAGASPLAAARSVGVQTPASVQAGEFQNRISGVLRGADGPIADVRISVTGDGFEG